MGAPALGCLPAFSPASPEVPSRVKLLCLGLGFWGSQPSFQRGLVEMGCSSRWRTANIRASPQTLRIGDTVFLSQRVSPSSKRPANPRPSSPAAWTGNERRMTQRPPLCSLGHLPCGSAGRATDVPTLVLPTLPVPLGKLCTLSAGGSTGGTRTPFFRPTLLAA